MRVRILFLFAFVGVSAQLFGQAGNLDALRFNAERKNAEWFNLHKALEDNLSRLLPCDPRAKTLLDDVNKASDARIEAWIAYTAEWRTQTANDSALARKTAAGAGLQISSARAGKARLEAQLADLRVRRAALPPASDATLVLDDLIALDSDRLTVLAERESRLEAAQQLITELASAADARAAAVDKEAKQWAEQAARWRVYYAARIARARTECSITAQPAARPVRKKQ